jgi:hypothetical protein
MNLIIVQKGEWRYDIREESTQCKVLCCSTFLNIAEWKE